MSWSYPGTKKLSNAQITTLMEQQGATPTQAAAFVGVAGAESGGNFGVVNNTAFPSLPNYAGPPGPGDSPEYSVGGFQENLYADGYTNPQQAYTAGQKLAASPSAQAATAWNLYQTRGFEPWEGDSYVKSAGGPDALQTDVESGQVPAASSNASTGTNTGSLTDINISKPFGSGETSPGGLWDPLNWPGAAAASAGNAVWGAVLPWILIGLGLIFIVVGIAVTFRGQQKITAVLQQQPAAKGAAAGSGAAATEDAAAVAA